MHTPPARASSLEIFEDAASLVLAHRDHHHHPVYSVCTRCSALKRRRDVKGPTYTSSSSGTGTPKCQEPSVACAYVISTRRREKGSRFAIERTHMHSLFHITAAASLWGPQHRHSCPVSAHVKWVMPRIYRGVGTSAEN